MHVHVYMCMCMYVCKYIHIYIYIYGCACAHAEVCDVAHVYVNSCIRAKNTPPYKRISFFRNSTCILNTLTWVLGLDIKIDTSQSPPRASNCDTLLCLLILFFAFIACRVERMLMIPGLFCAAWLLWVLEPLQILNTHAVRIADMYTTLACQRTHETTRQIIAATLDRNHTDINPCMPADAHSASELL